MSLEALRSGRITNAQTDGNREFISLVAAQHSIDTHVITGLHKAFKIEKKKSNKSKRLNLIGKEDDGGPIFFCLYSLALVKSILHRCS
jgi:hypothetical protein